MAAWFYGKVKPGNKAIYGKKIACIHLLTVSQRELYFHSHRCCVKITTTH